MRVSRVVSPLGVLVAALACAAPPAAAVSVIAYDRGLVDNSDEDNRIDESGVWAKPAAGGEATRLVKTGSGSLPDLAPDGGKLVYLDSPGGLTVSNIDGTGARTIFDPIGISGWVDFGPNGQIAVAARTTEPTPAGSDVNKLYVINADGSNLHAVYEPAPVYDPQTDTYGEYNLTSPSFSPDGARLTFVQSNFHFGGPGVSEGVHIINADGSGVTRLPIEGGAPVWSPDGTRVAFARGTGGQADIFLSRLDGTGLTNITNTPGVDETKPAFSPDGTRLAFESGTHGSDGTSNGDEHIETIGVDGSGRTDLTGADPGTESHPTWANVAALPPPPGGGGDSEACDDARARLDKAKQKLAKLRRNDAPKGAIEKARKKVAKAKKRVKGAC